MICYKNIDNIPRYVKMFISHFPIETVNIEDAMDVKSPEMLYLLDTLGYKFFEKEEINNCEYKPYRKEM